MNNFECYQVLGVSQQASIKDIKAAYRKLALKYHPDKNSSDRDGRKFKLITEAYQVLRVDYKRNIRSNFDGKEYDTKNSKRKYDFGNKGSWGARNSDRVSEDWTKYTRHTENAYQDFWKYYEEVFWEYYERVKENTGGETEPIQVERETPVAARVDPEKCIACCSCETIAPTVFHVEKNVRVNPKSRVINSGGAEPNKILDAAHTCPTKAISVTEIKTSRRLYPY